jgi:lipid-binding SYLF domain-containing protein
MKNTLKCLLLIYLSAAPTVADVHKAPDKRIHNATESVQEIMKVSDKGIPRDLFDKAQCVVIIPNLKKGAFVVGGKYGRGFASCRRKGDGWGPPAGVRIEGGSFGLQIGGSSTDILMLVMNQSGMNRLLSDKFTIGGEAAAAAGPVGRETSADTDILLHAEILSWSRSRGLFAGLSLEGATLRPDTEENQSLYGKDVTNKQILQGEVASPRAGRPLISALNRYSGGTSLVGSKATSASPRGSGPVTMAELHFATGQSEITPDLETSLSAAAKTLQDNRDWKIQVEGYTDSVGSKSDNEALSKQRAESVTNWLAEHGVDRNRLTVKGNGAAHPAADNSTDDGRGKNRRVELVRM